MRADLRAPRCGDHRKPTAELVRLSSVRAELTRSPRRSLRSWRLDIIVRCKKLCASDMHGHWLVNSHGKPERLQYGLAVALFYWQNLFKGFGSIGSYFCMVMY